MKFKSGWAALALLASVQATAATVDIDFEAVSRNARVNAFYNGGVDSAGLLGVALGVEFFDFVTTAGSGPRYAYSATGHGVINLADGFTGLAFDYGTVAPATISVYAGLGSSGALLGSEVLNGSASAFSTSQIVFSGLAHSVLFNSLPNSAALDNVRFTVTQAIPEASVWAMLLAGVAAIGAVQQRRPALFK